MFATETKTIKLYTKVFYVYIYVKFEIIYYAPTSIKNIFFEKVSKMSTTSQDNKYNYHRFPLTLKYFSVLFFP